MVMDCTVDSQEYLATPSKMAVRQADAPTPSLFGYIYVHVILPIILLCSFIYNCFMLHV